MSTYITQQILLERLECLKEMLTRASPERRLTASIIADLKARKHTQSTTRNKITSTDLILLESTRLVAKEQDDLMVETESNVFQFAHA